MRVCVQDPEQEFAKFLKTIEELSPKLQAAAKVSDEWGLNMERVA